MEQAMLWVTIIGIIVIPLLGWLLNTLITKKLDANEAKILKVEALFFRRLDDSKRAFELQMLLYVRKDLYDQERQFRAEQNDKELKNLLEKIEGQYKHFDEKIGEVKTLINEKFNHSKGD